MACIVLVGPMGAGKTTLGKKLAKSLDLPFFDTDKMVESVHGPIVKIFETAGEEVFRDYEQKALLEALGSGGVVATGGGVVLREAEREREERSAAGDAESPCTILRGKIS